MCCGWILPRVGYCFCWGPIPHWANQYCSNKSWSAHCFGPFSKEFADSSAHQLALSVQSSSNASSTESLHPKSGCGRAQSSQLAISGCHRCQSWSWTWQSNASSGLQNSCSCTFCRLPWIWCPETPSRSGATDCSATTNFPSPTQSSSTDSGSSIMAIHSHCFTAASYPYCYHHGRAVDSFGWFSLLYTLATSHRILIYFPEEACQVTRPCSRSRHFSSFPLLDRRFPAPCV